MATLTAAILPEYAAVRLTAKTLSGIQSVTRRDANGTNDVRTLPGVFGTAPASKEVRRNMVTNPSFENGTASGWSANRATVTTDAAGTIQGPRRVVVTCNAVGYMPRITTSLSGWTPGETITVSAYVAAGAGTVNHRMAVESLKLEADGVTYTPLGTAMSVESKQWASRLTLTVTIPANATRVDLWLGMPDNSPVGTAVSFDGVQAERGAAFTSYLDGSLPDTDHARYEWTGTPNGSHSIEIQPEPIIFTDYEPAHGPLAYDLVAMDGSITTLEVPAFTLDGPWLFTPVIPGYSRRVEAVLEVTAQAPTTSTVHDRLLGRFDPIVVMRPPGTRKGTLKIYAGTYADALDVLAPVRQATVMMLRQPDHVGLDMYFAALDCDIFHEVTGNDKTIWGVSVAYVELRRPEGPLAGALGWTYADLEAENARYADLTRTYASYADMRLGNEITP